MKETGLRGNESVCNIDLVVNQLREFSSSKMRNQQSVNETDNIVCSRR